jgi:hypothetical protein
MFGLFRKKPRRDPFPQVPNKLVFKSNEAAFEYACQFMTRRLHLTAPTHETKPEDLIVGFVHGAAEAEYDFGFKGTASYYDVSLAVDGGPVRVPRCGSILAETAVDILKAKVEPPRSGDLVLVEVGSYDPAYPVENAINYFVLAFRLKPEIDTATGSFRSELEDLASQR